MEFTPDEFERYLTGKASEDEQKRITKWIEENQDDSPKTEKENLILQNTWQRLEEIILSEEHPIIPLTKRKYSNLRAFYRVAASIAIVITGTWLYYSSKENTNKSTADILQVVQTHAAERKVINLADGSKVTLNSETELRFPSSFTKDDRVVKLKGEAFFEISPDKNRPFIIHTDSSKTKVLGTKFNLKAYPNDDRVELAVSEGKVLFGRFGNSDQIELTQGMLGRLTHHKPVVAEEINQLIAANWIEDILSFNNTRLDEVIKVLERRYNQNIQITNPALNSITITGEYSQMPLQDILKSLAFSTGISYQIRENRVILSK